MNKQFTPQIKSYPSQDCSIILWTTGLLKIKQRTFNIKYGLVKSTREFASSHYAVIEQQQQDLVFSAVN